MNRKAVLLLATIAIGLSFSWSEAFKHSKAIPYSKHSSCVPPSISSSPGSSLSELGNTLKRPIIRVRQSAFTRDQFLTWISLSCARLSFYKLPPPLEIEFFNVFQDDNIHIRVEWNNVEIKIDPNLKGMTLSYDREIDQMPAKIILTVPTKESLEKWVNEARQYYYYYEEAFWEEKELGRIELEEQERQRRETLDKLKQGPILVYPE